MLRCNFTQILISKHVRLTFKRALRRNVQVSIVGVSNDTGSNLALLLKQNPNINRIVLYDDDERVKGIADELRRIPGGPRICDYSGFTNLGESLKSSELIVMVYRIPRKPGVTREQMLSVNAPAVYRLCRAIVDYNPSAFLAIATNPINSIVPLASALLYKYGSYNPFKVVGVTQIDKARCRSLIANVLHVSVKDIEVPVIGGHSETTIVPLFSNISSSSISLNALQVGALTRLLRKAGTEIIYQKQGIDSATLAMAYALYEFVGKLVEAIKGNKVQVHCYSANPNFRTRFFAGPTVIGPCGIAQTCSDFAMSDYENVLLHAAVPLINRDVQMGEDFIRILETGAI